MKKADKGYSALGRNAKAEANMANAQMGPQTTITLNGERVTLMCDIPHIKTSIPEVNKLVVRVVLPTGDTMGANLASSMGLMMAQMIGQVIDPQEAETEMAGQLADSLYSMMEEALVGDSYTFEDLEEGLRVYVGATHHSQLPKAVKKALLKRLYNAQRRGSLNRLYKKLRKELEKAGLI